MIIPKSCICFMPNLPKAFEILAGIVNDYMKTQLYILTTF